MWDPDGAGPATPRLVLLGSVQGSPVTIVAFDPATGECTPLGPASIGAGQVPSVAALPNGDLVACMGVPPVSGSASGSTVARWDGTAWVSLGLTFWGGSGGAGPPAIRLAAAPNGHLFAHAHTSTTIWEYDGAGLWTNVTTAPFFLPPHAMAVLPNGTLVVASLGLGTASDLRAWDGTSWSDLGSGIIGVGSLTVRANGDLVVGGSFTTAGGVPANNIAVWNGSTWSALGTGTNAGVASVTELPNGSLVATGPFTVAGGIPAARVAMWDGTSWSALGAGIPAAAGSFTSLAACLPNGDVVVGGQFQTAGNVAARNVARWDGTSWHPLVSGLDGPVRAVKTLANGDVVIGGEFLGVNDVPVNRIARWNGTSWSPLGTGLPHIVQAIEESSNGDIFAGGWFGVARWNGSAWSITSFGSGNKVWALTRMPNGDIVAAGQFEVNGSNTSIARWDGTTWSPIGPATTNSYFAMQCLPNGDLLAGGSMNWVNGVPTASLARWDGSSWTPIPIGSTDPVWCMAVRPNGDIALGGSNGVWSWDGSSVVGLASGVNGIVHALEALPNGDLVVGGTFTTIAGVNASRVARWHGTSWSAFGTGASDAVYSVAKSPDDSLLLGGAFAAIDGTGSSQLTRLTTTCPATASSFGLGCPSSGGSNTLAATSLPWVGSTFRSEATGLPAISILVAVTSVVSIPQGVLPLSLVFAQAGPGCDVLVEPHLMTALVSTTGAAQFELFLPPSIGLVALPFYHQMAVIDVDGAGDWVEITATNSLQLCSGTF